MKNKKNKSSKTHSIAQSAPSPTDPLGMYTGRPADGGGPQQDADDL